MCRGESGIVLAEYIVEKTKNDIVQAEETKE